MIISRGRRYIFVHIPKTGGTALSLALEDRAMKDDVLIGDTPKARTRARRLKGVQARGRLWKHSTLADIEGLVTAEEIAESFVVTLVRNPWDRMVSYYHWLREQGWDHPAVRLAKAEDFAGFVAHPLTAQTFQLWPYGAYVRAPDGTEHCDLFARLEHLDADLAPFEAHLGVALTPLPRANASARARDWRGYYDDRTREIVGDLCAADIARFGYAFDG
ncbi:sulfotransferase family 2 domain-containing protein [Acidimangrovimonas sediminis]|uniref:sulfotransferase family 2 domain-containing protein n=1 Tax=Acidimangrovimonas sediminis TaxID=2056283 RepID=UPI000C7F90C7|nr:sulfotransferase family 2 domain-containing protein [Acidimangrovimonas sediminis]